MLYNIASKNLQNILKILFNSYKPIICTFEIYEINIQVNYEEFINSYHYTIKDNQDERDDDGGANMLSSFSASDSYSFKLLTNDCIKLPVSKIS